jgi:hypothetical protein
VTDFLKSLKDDLFDRRLLPFVALVAVGLVVAVGYALTSGGASSTSVPATPATGATAATGLAVSQSPASPDQPIAETTSGASAQRRGIAHNPFNPLPGTVKASTVSTTKASTTAGSSTTPSTGSGSSTSTGSTTTTTTTTTTTKPATPPKPATVYHVAVQFGEVPAGTLPASAQLTAYENLKLLTPLPSAKQPLLVFRGVTVHGKSATFTLVGETILHGAAACLPSATRCEEIDLKPGQSEQLEYLTAAGTTVVYELRVVSIVSSKASTAGVANVLRGQSKPGREVLRRAGLLAVPGLRYSSEVGVLVFAGRHASVARAHTAVRSSRRRG